MMCSGWIRPSSLVLSGVVLALTAAAGSRTTSAQAPSNLFFVPGRNVNTVGPAPSGPNPALVGNPRQKQRNEASCDVSPDNALVILCANNDYRGIELFGDSWIGLTQSRDGGLTWRSRLLDGFPSAPAGVGAADPVVRTVPGLGLIGYITLSRSDGRGTLALALLAARNKENGEPYQFLQGRVIGSGTPGRFNDKPSMTVVLNEAGGTIDVGGRQIPRGTIHYAYALFPGNENNSASQIYHLMSNDYGLTWTSPRKLSESLGTSQGVDLAVAGTIVVATWRQVADTNQQDGIVSARSTDGGQTWSKPAILWAGPGRFFDQDTSAVQFRTLSMPTVVHDGTAFHAFWSARGFAAHPDDARIVVSSSRDGRSWSAPSVVENFAGRGHQIVPQAAVAGGRIQVNWIDTRNNEPGTFDRVIADFRADASGNRVPLDAPAGPSDPPTVIYRQMADIFSAQSAAAPPNGQPALSFTPPAQVSRYRFGLVNGTRRQLEYSFINARMFKNGGVPFHGDYHAVSSQRYLPSETTPGAYVRNTAVSTNHAVFYSAFTDNRDVQGYVWPGPAATSFTPATTLQGESGTEPVVECSPSDTTPDTTVWSPTDSTRSRYQNIYAAATLPGLIVASPSASKPTGALERAFVIFAHNLTLQDRTYRFIVANQPADAAPAGTGRASFRPDDSQVPDTSCVDGAACTSLDVPISRASSVTRTVYVRSGLPRPRLVVRVQEQGGAGQTGSVILNPNPGVAEVETPDGDLPDILSYELYQPDILPRQTTIYSSGLVNPDVTPVSGIENPRIEYPRIEYPRIEYVAIPSPRIEYPRIEYDPLGNPRIEYPRIEYPRIEYKSVVNPRIEYSAIASEDPVAVTEVTWPVTTDGANTTTAMTAKLFVNGTLTGVTSAQLLVSIPHFTTVTRTCGGEPVTIVENQVVVNSVVDPASLARTSGGPDTVNPPAAQPSFFVQPNQVAYVTLRLVGRADALLASRAGIIVRSQPDTSDGDVSDEDRDAGFEDTTAPVINLGSLSGGITAEGNKPGGADVGFVVTATDEGGEPAVSCVRTGSGGSSPTPVPTDGTAAFYPIGSWQVSCTAIDPSGNQASAGFPVAVVDTKPPTLDVSALTISLTFTSGGAIVSYSSSAATATDLVDVAPTVVCVPPAGTVFPLGPGQVTCTATDDFGNTATATRSFAVTDTVAPVLTLPAPISVEATSAAGAVVAFSVTATDDVDSTPTVTCVPASGSTFPRGATLVSCVAVDDSGNASAPGTFTVTVQDTKPPTSIVATVTPSVIWPPSGALVPVTVSGQAFDGGSGVAAIEWRVLDEYKQYQPSGSVTVPGNGPFSFQVPLLADRRGSDKDGRHYTIQLTAVDRAGNRLLLAQPLAVNVHDQGS
jgi:hypothetical protein